MLQKTLHEYGKRVFSKAVSPKELLIISEACVCREEAAYDALASALIETAGRPTNTKVDSVV
jgi:hypothetical protein